MATLNKKLYIQKGSVQQNSLLYTTAVEAGNAYSYIVVDGTQCYIPLVSTNDSRATNGRVKEHTGTEWAISVTGKPLYAKISYTTAGTYTWTCPVGVTTAKVTCAGGGGGGSYIYNSKSGAYVRYDGADGELNTGTVSVAPNTTYSIVVGAGGEGRTVSTHNVTDGGYSSAISISANGGPGGTLMSDKSGGQGGEKGNDGSSGWVYIEYGGDI